MTMAPDPPYDGRCDGTPCQPFFDLVAAWIPIQFHPDGGEWACECSCVEHFTTSSQPWHLVRARTAAMPGACD
jgi:hypothetical protein